MAGPGHAAGVNQQTRRHVRINRKGERDQSEQSPPKWTAGKNSPAGNQQQYDGRSQKTATQVVENLPARDRRDAIGLFIPVGVAHYAPQPAGDLPIAARPTMLAHRVGVVVCGIVIEEFDVTDQRRAREYRFKKIVTQQSIVGDSTVEGFLKSVNIVKTLTSVAAFTEQILVNVRGCRRVGIDSGVA